MSFFENLGAKREWYSKFYTDVVVNVKLEKNFSVFNAYCNKAF